MKSFAIILLAFGVIGTFSFAVSRSGDEETSDSAIMTYYPYKGAPYVTDNGRAAVTIYYGNGKVEHIKQTEADRKLLAHTVAVDALNRLKAEGYTLVSTTIFGADPEIQCFLQKR